MDVPSPVPSASPFPTITAAPTTYEFKVSRDVELCVMLLGIVCTVVVLGLWGVSVLTCTKWRPYWGDRETDPVPPVAFRRDERSWLLRRLREQAERLKLRARSVEDEDEDQVDGGDRAVVDGAGRELPFTVDEVRACRQALAGVKRPADLVERDLRLEYVENGGLVWRNFEKAVRRVFWAYATVLVSLLVLYVVLVVIPGSATRRACVEDHLQKTVSITNSTSGQDVTISSARLRRADRQCRRLFVRHNVVPLVVAAVALGVPLVAVATNSPSSLHLVIERFTRDAMDPVDLVLADLRVLDAVLRYALAILVADRYAETFLDLFFSLFAAFVVADCLQKLANCFVATAERRARQALRPFDLHFRRLVVPYAHKGVAALPTAASKVTRNAQGGCYLNAAFCARDTRRCVGFYFSNRPGSDADATRWLATRLAACRRGPWTSATVVDDHKDHVTVAFRDGATDLVPRHLVSAPAAATRPRGRVRVRMRLRGDGAKIFGEPLLGMRTKVKNLLDGEHTYEELPAGPPALWRKIDRAPRLWRLFDAAHFVDTFSVPLGRPWNVRTYERPVVSQSGDPNQKTPFVEQVAVVC